MTAIFRHYNDADVETLHRHIANRADGEPLDIIEGDENGQLPFVPRNLITDILSAKDFTDTKTPRPVAETTVAHLYEEYPRRGTLVPAEDIAVAADEAPYLVITRQVVVHLDDLDAATEELAEQIDHLLAFPRRQRLTAKRDQIQDDIDELTGIIDRLD